MSDRDKQFRVGVVVFATAILIAILIVLFGDADSFWKSHKTIYVKFPEAPGIMVDSPVRKSGILIGRVTAVDFAPDGQILVTIQVDDEVKLYRTDQARIRTSLLGDATLEFVPGRAPAKPLQPRETKQAGEPLSDAEGDVRAAVMLVAQAQPPQPPVPPPAEEELIGEGEVIQGEVVPGPTEVIVNLEEEVALAARSLSAASRRVDVLAGRLNEFFEANDEQLGRILAKSEIALDSFNRTMGTFDQLVGDEEFRQNLRRALEELPVVLDETREAMVSVQRAAALADENLTNLRGFTAPLGERGDEIVAKIESGIISLDELLAQLSVFSQSINESEGSLGQLVRNPDLYQNLNQAALNIRCLTQQLEPILRDVRIFTDKIARDPGRLGVSGALRKDAPIK